MCCSGSPSLTLPGPVAEMLAEYRHLVGQDWLWGEGQNHGNAAFLAQLRFVSMGELMGPAFQRVRARHPDGSMQEWIEAALSEDPDDLLRAALAGRVPTGLIALRLDDAVARVESSGCRPVLAGSKVEFSLLVDSMRDRAAILRGGSSTRTVGPQGAALLELVWEANAGCLLEVDGEPVDIGEAFRTAEAARLRLRSGRSQRWSVVDESGGAWFPDGMLRKWDYHKRPFFHGADLVLEVPAGPLSVTAWRGMEYGEAHRLVDVQPGDEALVELDPPRRYDPASTGWYGGDLHVHMNYAGDEVCTPDDAARMQLGEGLHLVNLVAGNCTSSRIFDREALETWAGEDLPWSEEEGVARMGVEYRNDLLGHFHALSPARPPLEYHSGHAGSDRDEDWPPNSVAAAAFRELGATVGYCHPVLLPIEDDPGMVFDLMPRSVEAREVVVDAALGLVDSLDVLSNMSGPGSAVLYRKMIGAGRRLAVTAGTDCFLSFSRCVTFSNPPGWARAYARLDGPLTVAAFQEAVRRGRTVGTNGPWLELTVEGKGPGETVAADAGTSLRVIARLIGPGAERLRLLTADGELAAVDIDGGKALLEAELPVTLPTYVVAEAVGGAHPEILDQQTFAHTSPVYVELGGRSVARARDAEWCLDWIDRLEALARRSGTFHRPEHLDDLVGVLDEARAIYRHVAATGD